MTERDVEMIAALETMNSKLRRLIDELQSLVNAENTRQALPAYNPVKETK